MDSGEGGSVEIAWFAVWKSWSPDIKVSFVISLLFPIYYYAVLASRYKTFGMDDVFAGCIFLCGVLEYGMLAETENADTMAILHGDYSLQYFWCILSVSKNFAD